MLHYYYYSLDELTAINVRQNTLLCLQHPPLYAQHSKLKLTTNYTVLQQPTPQHCGTLRRSWNTQQPLSPQAQELWDWQSNCSLSTVTFHLDNSFGFGSHLYLWSQALCNAMEMNRRVRTVVHDEPWLWWDAYHCAATSSSPWECYFPLAEPSCPIGASSDNKNVTNPRNHKLRCQRLQNNPDALQQFRAATMEYLFHTVSPLVLQEASRQTGLLFPGGQAPPDLITVHIRWGDKFWEMDLVPIEEYLAAVQQLVMSSSSSSSSTDANIYLATEDPRAAEEFMATAPPQWNIYIDRTLTELAVVRPPKGNRASWTAKNTHGRAGLMNMASWLIALEANRFVLTTASNWSRVVNELRKTVVDPVCGNCTQLIDLRPGVW